MSVTAYKRTISHTEAPRQIERRILVQVTAELEKQFEDFDKADRRIERLEILANGLRHTVWKNQTVWMAFKSDLLEKENALPDSLRGALASLAVWVENHSQGVLSGGKNIRPLIDVNRSIIDGLSGQAYSAVE